MSAQSLLSSVFSCSSPAAPAARSLSKRRLRQTRSLDPAIIGGGRDEGEGRGRAAGSPPGERRGARGAPPPPRGFSASTPSTPLERSPPGSGLFEPDSPRGKRSPGRELPFLARTPSANSIFSSPRRWLQQRKGQPSPPGPRPAAYVVWRSEGDFTWNSMSGRSVRLKSVPVQSLSELERARLQEVAFYQLQQDYDLGCQIAIPKDGQKRKKSLRKKLDSLGKEKNRDKEFIPQAFGMPLSQVIANDRAYKLKQDSQREEQKDVSDFVAFLLPFGTKRQNKELSSSNSSLSSTSETPNESTSPNTPEPAPRARRRGAMSVDSITDLDDNQSRLLEALQLSLPAEAQSKKEKARDKKLSLNPIYRQVPRLVDSCCQHLEKHGLQTVGIFRVGSSKKRVRQLREEFDRGIDVVLDEEHSIHDVAALLKEFLRDMPDPLLTRELYTPFINTLLLEPDEQLSTLQLLIYLLPPCNCDTLHRLLQFLSTVAGHAEDTTDKDGQEITGNKMTSLNLATIFGPNLLHKQKSTDKEFTVQSSARAEESTAIIAVVQKMIENYEALFMVSPDLQNEVLISLLETDPDVVDYLLRRKASQSSPEMLRSEGSYSTGERHSSTDSNKASSGDVSPYDNNSPVLSERSLMATQEEVARSPDKLYRVPEQYTLVGHLQPKTKENSSASQAGKDVSEDHFDIWGTWHSTLKSGCKDTGITGSYGNIYESSLLRPGQCSLSQGNLSIYSPRWQGSSSELDSSRQVMRRSQTTAAIPECQLHPAPSRVCSNPHIEASSRSLDQSRSKSERHLTLSSVEDLTEYDLHAGCSQSTAKPSYRKERPPPPYPGPAKTSSALSQRSGVSSTLHSLWRLQRQEKSSGTRAAGGPAAKAPEQAISRQERSAPHTQVGNIYSTAAHNQNSKNVSEPDWHDWQRERWQIWELLSADNPDALPETLV
ncbi:rho GTPase-activating protein 6 isoform X2 [Anas platyrhynchos]|uniref:rho GTPase-activating protein 6 isoform X2 n=1 Tax=Anas platyrhynchos TaxID=8839 RepID=UPI000F7C8CAC|nr:rho GTPase-activating protein 6 isoform X2 [Anas platyrhynchos]|eukprot:XP_027303430.1 rho GTPase-activating protein 6 isoform X2 [Anas platyrhynchos]